VSLFSRGTVSLTDVGVPGRAPRGKGARVTADRARQNSAVWACLRLRGDLISTMPVDAYREVGGIQVEVTKPPVLITPGGKRWKMHAWLYAGQVPLDSAGNNVGLITVRDGLGLPAVVELQDLAKCSLIVRDGKPHQWRINGQLYDLEDVWHERQYDVAGAHLGLSPTAYAAYTLEQYSSAQEFAREWFGGSAIPAAALKNSEKIVPSKEARDIKDRFRASVDNGGLFVHGKDWEYKPIQSLTADAAWLEGMRASLVDIARFFGCPADVIDAAVSGQSVTYANIGQRNLQLLIHNLSAPVKRREDALSDLLPAPRFVKLNSDAILRMDPETRAKVLGQKVRDRLMAPSEARALDNLQPYTEDQYAEFDRLFGSPKKDKALSPAEVVQKGYLGVQAGVIETDELRQWANDAGANLPIGGM
jgi:HK97 family phage portal protein